MGDRVGWVEATKPNIAFIPYLNLLGFTSFNPTYTFFLLTSMLSSKRLSAIAFKNMFLSKDK